MIATIAGWDRLRANLGVLREYVQTDAREVTNQELRAVAEDMAAAARLYAPVLTGNLQALINVIDDGEGNIELRSDAPYSLFVEFGTIKMAAKPFMRRAFEEYGVFHRLQERHRSELEDRLVEA